MVYVCFVSGCDPADRGCDGWAICDDSRRPDMSAGKGDSPRPIDGGKYRENWDRIFRRKNGKAGKYGRNGK